MKKSNTFQRINLFGCMITILFLVACQRELVFDKSFNEDLVVLNGVFVADSSPMSVSLHWSQNLGVIVQSQSIEADSVLLFCDEHFIGAFENNDSCYLCKMAPVSGKTYKVEAYVNKQITCAETTIPKPVPVSYLYSDTVIGNWDQKHLQHFFSVTDDPTIENVYWFWEKILIEGDSKYKQIYPVYSGALNIDNFTKAEKTGSGFIYEFFYEYFARIPDTRFSGQEYVFDVAFWGTKGNRVIYFSSFDEHYDKYLKSYLTYESYSSSIEELPIYYQPSFIYSNVHNGTGILGSMASYSKTFIDTY